MSESHGQGSAFSNSTAFIASVAANPLFMRFRGLPMHLIARNHFRSRDKVPGIQVPKLFIHGTADETVPFVVGEALFEAAGEPKAWYPVAHAGHNDVYRFGGVRYLWRLVRFSRTCLSSARKASSAPAGGA